MAAAPAVARSEGPGDASVPAAPPGPPTDLSRTAVVTLAAVVIAGLGFRLFSRSSLWLDEALSVNLASVPLAELGQRLREDGAPPLYYLLLHGWIRLFGSGDVAVRLLSALFSAAALPLYFVAGRRRGGRVVGVGALVIAATSPFAIRYATEARMYSLVALLVVAGWLALTSALDRPRALTLIACGLVAGLLVLTHYWSFYLLAVVLATLVLTAWRRPGSRRNTALTGASVAVGAVACFAPWLSSFLYQAQHTGTPWGTAPGPVEIAFTTLVDFGGGPFPEGQAMAGILAALGFFAVFGAAIDHRRVELDLRTRPGGRRELAVAGATLLLASAAGLATDSAFASRYTAVIFPLVVVGVACGIAALADRRVVALTLAAIALLGLVGGVRNVVFRRTSADRVVALIEANGGRPGDLIVYCPDQLGPDVARLLPPGYQQATFPDGASPAIVNWVDYASRVTAANPAAFADAMLRRAGDHDLWYVWMPGYRTLGEKCERINDAFGNARPGNRQLLAPDPSAFERHVLWLHPAQP